MRAFRSIRARFTGWYLIVLAVLLALLSTGLYFTISVTLRRHIDADLRHRSAQLAGTMDILQSVREGRFEEELGELVALYTHSDDGYEVVATREVEPLIDVKWVDAAFRGMPSFETATAEGRRVIRFHIALIRAPAGRPTLPETREAGGPGPPPPVGDSLVDPPLREPTVLVLGQPMDILHAALAALRTTLLIAIPVALIVSAVGGLFLLRRVLRPVDLMIKTARGIEEKDLAARIEVTTQDELGRLAATLNAMLERLESAFRRQRQFTDDASHELRSPLSVIEGEATLALRRERSAEDYRDALATIADEAAGMKRLIDQLLTLARADSSESELVREDLDLSVIVRETIEAMRPIAEEQRVELTVGGSERAELIGDSVRLRRLVVNLVDNAIRYTPRGGTVTIFVERTAGEIVLTVADTGIGIAPDHVAHVFERFYRADAARQRGKGSGLGLSICKQIVEEHVGAIAVESHVGEGTKFEVRLPMA